MYNRYIHTHACAHTHTHIHVYSKSDNDDILSVFFSCFAASVRNMDEI